MGQGWPAEYVVFFAAMFAKKNHNFGVPVLTLSHILDISDIGGQWYTDMWYQSYWWIVILLNFTCDLT